MKNLIKVTVVLASLVLPSLTFASQPPPPRTLSAMKVNAVLEKLSDVVGLQERLIGVYEESNNQYTLEKVTRQGKCVAVRFDLKYIPGHIPGFFTIEAEVSPLRIYTACRLMRVSR